MTLPPFPVTDDALDLLSAAINPDWTTAQRTSLHDLLGLFSEMGGSNTTSVESEDDEVRFLRDPLYAPSDVIAALIDEVRRLRGGT